MYGKWVTLYLGEGYKVEVHVGCTPDTCDAELQLRAWSALRLRVGAV
jgi:hypothetical protein